MSKGILVIEMKPESAEAVKSGQMSPPVGVALDPPPTMRYFRLVTDSD